MSDQENKQVRVKFQVNQGQKVLNQPELFMALESDAIEWERIGVGVIVKEKLQKSDELKDTENIDNKNTKKK